jgi:hypothetical protein
MYKWQCSSLHWHWVQGNMVGGALQVVSWAVQVGVACALAGATGVYGVVVSMVMLAKADTV